MDCPLQFPGFVCFQYGQNEVLVLFWIFFKLYFFDFSKGDLRLMLKRALFNNQRFRFQINTNIIEKGFVKQENFNDNGQKNRANRFDIKTGSQEETDTKQRTSNGKQERVKNKLRGIRKQIKTASH